MPKYDKTEGEARVGEVIESPGGNRFLVLTGGRQVCIEHTRGNGTSTIPRAATQPCRIIGPIGEYLDEAEMHETIINSAGLEVAFIYNSGMHGSVHAVVKKINGPWSENRIGFCGTTPTSGPVNWCKEPSGGLCHICDHYVEKDNAGVWRVKYDPVLHPFQRYTPESVSYGCYEEDD